VLRWIYCKGMDLLLRRAGFTLPEFSGSFDRRPLRHDPDVMNVEARAATLYRLRDAWPRHGAGVESGVPLQIIRGEILLGVEHVLP